MDNQTETTVQKEDSNRHKENVSNYFQYAMQVIKDPDYFLSEKVHGKHQFGLTTIIIFLVLVVLSSLTGLIGYFDTLKYFGFSDYFNYFERGLAYAGSLALLIFIFKTVAEKNEDKYDFNFLFEKLGALLVIPSALLLLSLPLNILDITIHSWVSSLAYTFLYLSIFLISYLFIAKNNLKTGLLFVAGFYFVYQILRYIL